MPFNAILHSRQKQRYSFNVSQQQHCEKTEKERKSKTEMEEVKANQRIRDAMTESGLLYWRLADLLKVTSWTLSVWMRHEMPEEKQERILNVIREESERLKNGSRA